MPNSSKFIVVSGEAIVHRFAFHRPLDCFVDGNLGKDVLLMNYDKPYQSNNFQLAPFKTKLNGRCS